MPGYMIHLAEAQMILNRIAKDKNLSEKLCSLWGTSYNNDFILGNILPDATSDKELTHFRPEWQKSIITKYPDIDAICEKYKGKLSTACDYGILAHYILDTDYVVDFWPKYISFEDIAGNYNAKLDGSAYVRIKNQDIVLPLKTFFSEDYFYGEYDRLNPLIKQRINPSIPDISTLPSINIEECANLDLTLLSEHIDRYVLSEDYGAGSLTEIFPYDSFISFMESTADKFISLLEAL